jgi:hypothetical protein
MRLFKSTLTIILLSVVTVLLLFSLSSSFSATKTMVNAQEPDQQRRRVDLQFFSLAQYSINGNFYRTKVPGGWIVAVSSGGAHENIAMVFVPDPEHTWDGKSLK